MVRLTVGPGRRVFRRVGVMNEYVRFLGGRRIGLRAIAFTGPGLKDAYGSYWTSESDLAMQRYDKRPLYYQHQGNMVEAGLILASDCEARDDGLWVEVDLLDNEAGNACLELVQRRKGFGSTGVMPGSWRERDDGFMEFWPWVECSITDHPATKADLTRADIVRSCLGIAGDGDEFLRRGPIMPENDNGTGTPETVVPVQDEVGLKGADVSGLREDIQGLTDAVRELAQEPPGRSLPGGQLPELLRPRVPQVEVAHRYDGMTLLGLLVRTFAGRERKVWTAEEYTEAVRAIRAKMERQLRIDEKLTDRELMYGAVRMVDQEAVTDWGRHLRADEAMTSVYDGYGDQLVPTLLNSVVWYHLMLDAKVLNALPRFQMPSQPFDYPTVTGGPTFRAVAEVEDQANFGVHNSVIPASKISTSKITFSAGKIGALVLGSEELFEDAGVSLADVWSTQLVRQMASAIDYVLLNGDETAAGTNISHFGTDPTGTAYDKILALDGMRHIAVGNSDATGQTSVDQDSPTALRETMGSRGVFGIYPRDLLIIADPAVYYDFLALDAFETVANMGPHATLLTGLVGGIKGVPMIVADELEATNASGQIEDSHDSALASYLVVNRALEMVGFRRQVSAEIFPVRGAEGFAADITVRLDLQEMEAGSVAYGYNVGGS